MKVAWAAAAALLLAGCSSDPSRPGLPSSTSAPTDPPDPGPVVPPVANASWSNTTHDLEVTQATAAGFGILANPCLWATADSLVRLVEGRVSGTWSPAAPTELRLEAGRQGEQPVAVSAYGAAGAEIILPPIDLASKDLYVRLVAKDPPGMSAKTPVRLDVRLLHQGPGNPSPTEGPC